MGQVRHLAECDNDPKHFGGISFESSKDTTDFDITVDDVRAHMMAIEGVEGQDILGTPSFAWRSNGFACNVDIAIEEGFTLFQYLCHYIEE